MSELNNSAGDSAQSLDAIVQKMEAEDAQAETETSNELEATQETAQGEPETAIADSDEKSSDKVEIEPGTAIEPPVSWPADDKIVFQSLPPSVQERIVARDNEQNAHFTQKMQTLAARERDISQIEQSAAQARSNYLAGLDRISQMASQLLPAQFSDIPYVEGEGWRMTPEFITLKAQDPARASQYESFRLMLDAANQQQGALRQQRMQQHLASEYEQLVNKFPEFKDETKARSILDDVRKTATDYYGFSPDEVANILDHRYVPILRDAKAWRNHQASLRAAEAKKTAPVQKAVLKPAANTGANVADDQKAKILNRAKSARNDHEVGALLAQLI